MLVTAKPLWLELMQNGDAERLKKTTFDVNDVANVDPEYRATTCGHRVPTVIDEWTPLTFAIFKMRNEDLVHHLLERGAEPNHRVINQRLFTNSYGGYDIKEFYYSPLDYGFRLRNRAICFLLLKAGASLCSLNYHPDLASSRSVKEHWISTFGGGENDWDAARKEIEEIRLEEKWRTWAKQEFAETEERLLAALRDSSEELEHVKNKLACAKENVNLLSESNQLLKNELERAQSHLDVLQDSKMRDSTKLASLFSLLSACRASAAVPEEEDITVPWLDTALEWHTRLESVMLRIREQLSILEVAESRVSVMLTSEELLAEREMMRRSVRERLDPLIAELGSCLECVVHHIQLRDGGGSTSEISSEHESEIGSLKNRISKLENLIRDSMAVRSELQRELSLLFSYCQEQMCVQLDFSLEDTPNADQIDKEIHDAVSRLSETAKKEGEMRRFRDALVQDLKGYQGERCQIARKDLETHVETGQALICEANSKVSALSFQLVIGPRKEAILMELHAATHALEDTRDDDETSQRRLKRAPMDEKRIEKASEAAFALGKARSRYEAAVQCALALKTAGFPEVRVPTVESSRAAGVDNIVRIPYDALSRTVPLKKLGEGRMCRRVSSRTAWGRPSGIQRIPDSECCK